VEAVCNCLLIDVRLQAAPTLQSKEKE